MWKIEAARIFGGLARRVGDVGLAEDLAQDALLAALEYWPVHGIAPNPGAWLAMTGSPVIRVNHAVAAGMAHGPLVGLEMLAPLLSEPALQDYTPLWAAHGLRRAGHMAEAGIAFEVAAALTGNAPERAALLVRAGACSSLDADA